jgi:energy-coupling factor transport system permease protein
MIGEISFGQYIKGNSILHRADPRSKFVNAFLFMLVIFTISSYSGFLLSAIFLTITYTSSKISLNTAIKAIKPIMFIAIFAGVVNIFTIKGDTLFTYGIINISYEGVNIAIKTTLRLLMMILGFSIVIYTTTPISLTDGIEKIMNPFKKIGIPVHEIAMMMTIALRFIPTIIEETDKIMKAQLSRGANFDSGNPIKRVKSYIPVLIPLFVSTFRRADELAYAMEARCYRGSEGRTKMKILKFSKEDIIISAFLLIFIMGLITTNILNLI